MYVELKQYFLVVQALFWSLVLSGQALYQANVNAFALNDSCFQLTANQMTQRGSVWYLDQINLNDDFIVKLSMYFGTNPNGADGLTFAIQQQSTSAGGPGSGLGMSGVSPSIFIEFDTYQNGNLGDPSFHHTALMANGNPDHLNNAANIAGPVPLLFPPLTPPFGPVSTGVWHDVLVKWIVNDDTTQTIQMFFNCLQRIEHTTNFIANYFNNNPLAYWGFTGSTGALHNVQQVCVNYVSFFDPADGDQTICSPGDSVQITAPDLGYAFSWTPDSLVSNPNIRSPMAFPTVTTMFYVELAGYCGDVIYDSVLVVVSDPVEAEIDLIRPACYQASDGSAAVTVTNGIGPFSYLWSDPDVQVSDTAVNLSTGNYLVVVTDLNGCETEFEINIPELDSIAIDAIQINDALCYGDSTGSIHIEITGGNEPYQVFWDDVNSQTTDSVSGLHFGSYNVYIEDYYGCIGTNQFFIDEPPPLELTLSTMDVSCYQGSDGTVTVQVEGGQPPYWVQWNGGNYGTDFVLDDVTAGTYIVTVADSNGCTITDSIVVNEPPAFMVSLDMEPLACFDDNSGIANISYSGGIEPYSVNWSNGENSSSISGLSSGWYFATATDGNNCEVIDSILVAQPDAPILVNVAVVNALCFNESNGSAQVVASGGTGLYDYSWSDQTIANVPNATGLAAGNYSVTVSDENGCEADTSFSVEQPDMLELSFGALPAGCFGGAMGLVYVAPSGGVIPYTYTWDNPGSPSSDTIMDLEAGVYTVTVGDANGCSVTGSVELGEASPIIVEVETVDATCHGSSDGIASITVSGGEGSYNVVWSNGQSGFQASYPQGEQYEVIVYDSLGCSSTATFDISEPDAIAIEVVDITHVLCHGETTGAVTINVTGGVGSYGIVWNDPSSQLGVTAVGLGAGMYEVMVTDSNDCIGNYEVTITEPTFPLTASTESFPTSCNTSMDGSIDVIPFGGIMPYSYQWSTGGTNASIYGLTQGLYSVTVTDANGCSYVANAEVDAPQPIDISVSMVSEASCFQAHDGIALATGSGGTPGVLPNPMYTYQWSTVPVQTTQQAVGLIGGNTYMVTITDHNGCTKSESITIGHPDPINITVETNDAWCYNEPSGEASVTGVSGGVPGFQYIWSQNANAATTQSVNNLMAGTYSVTVTDANNCTAVASAVISQPVGVSVNFINNHVDCIGEASGSSYVQVLGGTPNFNFQWSNGQQGQSAANLEAGQYTLTVTDANNCEEVFTTMITEPQEGLDLELDPHDATCWQGQDGAIYIMANGGTPNYSYRLNGGDLVNEPAFLGLTAGEYLVEVIDENGCMRSAEVVLDDGIPFYIDHSSPYTLNYGEQIPLVVAVNLHPSISLNYHWSNFGPLSLSCYDCSMPVASPEITTWYYLTVTDPHGCTAETMLQVIVEQNRKIFVASAFTPNGDGTNDYLFVQGPIDATVEIFQVFDRWGSNVFQSVETPLNVAHLGWDGSFHGTLANSGVFTWQAVVRFSDGYRHHFSGHSNLIR